MGAVSEIEKGAGAGRAKRVATSSRWFCLPTLPLSDGGRARRLNVPIDDAGLFSIVLSATDTDVGVSFELVEWRGGDDHGVDPRLGSIEVDGRTACFGLVETSRTSLVFTALSAAADDRLIDRLRHGRQLAFSCPERHLVASLEGMRPLFDHALKSVCDPDFAPLSRWLRQR